MKAPAPARSSLGFAAVLLLAVAAPAPLQAATSVTVSTANRDGGLLVVSGQASFDAAPFVSLGTDAASDQLPPGANLLGKDVTGFSVSASPGASITFRWHLSALAPGANRGLDVSYGKAFCVTPSEDPNCWVVTFIDVGALNSFVWSWKCADESCAIASGDSVHTWETDQYDATNRLAIASFPASDLGITPGSTLTPAASATFQGSPVFVTTPWWFLFTSGTYPTYDATAIDGSYQVPAKEVSLAIGAPGQAPSEVEYGAAATLDDANRFVGEIDVSTLAPGSYALYARACFGGGNCGYTTRGVSL